MENEQLALVHTGTELTLTSGDRLTEHDLVDTFYVLLDGEVAVVRGVGETEETFSAGPSAASDGMPVLLGTSPTISGVRILRPSRFLKVDADAYLEHIAGWSPANTIIVGSLVRRVHDAIALLRQQEKLAALGKLSAGLAHELNNPASAAHRAADHMRECLDILAGHSGRLSSPAAAQLDALVELEREALGRQASRQPEDPLSLAEREDAVTSWLGAHDIADGWRIAPGLAEAGLDLAWLEAVAARSTPAGLGEMLVRVEARLRAERLVDEIEQSTGRIAELVGALKAHTYRDQAPVQEVDIHQGLENTLVILNHKLQGDISVHREYDPGLPQLTAFGSELNQVWAILIENAIDAVQGQGNIWLRTASRGDWVVVEVADDGRGVPAEIQPHVFAPFITTKAQGQGTGIGLHTAYTTVVHRHRGSLEFTSQPGATCFRVILPVQDPPADRRD